MHIVRYCKLFTAEKMHREVRALIGDIDPNYFLENVRRPTRYRTQVAMVPNVPAIAVPYKLKKVDVLAVNLTESDIVKINQRMHKKTQADLIDSGEIQWPLCSLFHHKLDREEHDIENFGNADNIRDEAALFPRMCFFNYYFMVMFEKLSFIVLIFYS